MLCLNGEAHSGAEVNDSPSIFIFFSIVTNPSWLIGCRVWRQGMDSGPRECSNLFSGVLRGFGTSMVPVEALLRTQFVNVTSVDSTKQQINSKSILMLL